MITTRIFGRHEGRDVVEAILDSGQACVAILSYGCVIRDWRVAGYDQPLVLGFDRLEDYVRDKGAFGVIAGRVANRTERGRFSLGGRDYQLSLNHGGHHLHGGAKGLQRRHWQLDTDTAANSVRLTYHSPDGEEGYPGAVDFTLTFNLLGTVLEIVMTGLPDRPTPINLAQHNYYNLNGQNGVSGHWLKVAADAFTILDDGLIPTGEISPVSGTRWDFRCAVRLDERDPDRQGMDINLVLNADRDRMKPAAQLGSKDSGLTLSLWTDEPGLQLFDAPKMQVDAAGLEGRSYGPFGGLCLEPQHFPNSLNIPAFPSIIRSPENPYYQKLTLDISG